MPSSFLWTFISLQFCFTLPLASLTGLPSPRAIDIVLTGKDGVIDSLASRAVAATWVDMSTNDQSETLRLGALCQAKGINVLEAPVTGGVHKAAHGDITVLVGGEQSVFQAHEKALNAMGKPVLYIGKLGSAAVIKVITNMLAFIHLVAAGEALMLAKRGGLDLGVAFEAIKESSGNSFENIILQAMSAAKKRAQELA